MFKFIFDFITEAFGSITGNPIYDFVLVLIISQILLYPIVYRMVGRIYASGLIEGRAMGSLLHWLIRGIFFIMTVAIIKLILFIYLLIQRIF